LFQDVVQSGVGLVVGVGVLLFISWQLTLSVLLVAPLVAGVIAAFGRQIRHSAQRRQESQSDVTQRLLQILSGI
jgi:ATP-binding cassette subfamily B protein